MTWKVNVKNRIEKYEKRTENMIEETAPCCQRFIDIHTSYLKWSIYFTLSSVRLGYKSACVNTLLNYFINYWLLFHTFCYNLPSVIQRLTTIFNKYEIVEGRVSRMCKVNRWPSIGDHNINISFYFRYSYFQITEVFAKNIQEVNEHRKFVPSIEKENSQNKGKKEGGKKNRTNEFSFTSA